MKRNKIYLMMAATLATVSSGAVFAGSGQSLYHADKMPLVRTIDERFQSFQIGMSHLTGGETWRTYEPSEYEGEGEAPEEFAEVRERREAADLEHLRLRTLTAALGPLYIRYGGTTANSVYFQNNDEPRLEEAPEGYLTVLTREAWKGALDFAQAVDAKVLTGFTVSPGVRDGSGTWTPVHAESWLNYTHSIGGKIHAAELYNEPNAPEPDWDADGHRAEDYARDFAVFRAFISEAAPHTKVAGPGVIELGIPIPIPSLEHTSVEEYMTAEPQPEFDVVSYHFYGAISERCVPADSPAAITAEDALSEAWLARPDASIQKHRALRDQYAPDAPIWLTETGAASCGGTRWQPTFLDTFRYLDTQARLAKQGLDAIFTHALISRSNGVIDEDTFMPNASYWAALLWRQLMGVHVLDAGPAPTGLHLYAHCQRDIPGGVSVLALNLQDEPVNVGVSSEVDLYALTATELQSSTVLLNGVALELGDDDSLPDITSQRLDDGTVELSPFSVNFIAMPEAGNASCSN